MVESLILHLEKSIFILLFIQLQSTIALSQEKKDYTNYVYAEALGDAGYYSLNYEKTLFKYYYSRTYLRVGFGITYDPWIKPLYPNKPVTFFLTYNMPFLIGNEVGKKNLRYEYGIGIDISAGENIRHLNMLVFHKDSKYSYTPCGLLGLRYSLQKKPIFFRLSLTPLYDITENKLLPWAGASVGYTF